MAQTKAPAWALIIAGLTGAASGLFLAYVSPSVTDDRFSFPLTVSGFTAIQCFFFVHHLALAWGIYAVWRRGLAGDGSLARIGGLGSVLAMTALAVQELVAISAANADYPSAQTDFVEGVYGVLSMLNGVTLTLLGIAAVRARRVDGWRRYAVLVVGIYVFAPLTPAIFGPYVVARLAISVWMLLFLAVGIVLLQAPTGPPPAHPKALCRGTKRSGREAISRRYGG